MSLDRRAFLALAAGAAVACSSFEPPVTTAARRPHLIFILADDLGYGEVGCYGQTKIRTPHIDALAAEGMRFTDAYSGSTVCAPSRSVLMSGLHTGRSPVRANGGGNPIRPEDWTVGEVLKQAGYRTGCFGKWGLGDIETEGVPWKQGFDEFFGYVHQVHAHFYYPAYLWKNAQKYPLEGNSREKAEGAFSGDVIHEHAMAFLEDHVTSSRALQRQSPGDTHTPFFLYLAYTLPHGEYQVPEDSIAEYRGQFEEKPIEPRGDHDGQAEPFAAYAGMITRFDRYVGEVMAKLKKLDIDQETLVIFTSDNGPSPPHNALDLFDSAGPLRGRKGNLYEGGIRVPFIARWPGHIAAGSESALPVAFWDFLPTAAELAETSVGHDIDGVSIAPTLTGEGEQQLHEYLYWEHPGGDLANVVQAVRAGRWKGIRTAAGKALELYDLEADIGETSDVAAEHPDIIARLEAYLAKAHTEPRPHFRKGWTP